MIAESIDEAKSLYVSSREALRENDDTRSMASACRGISLLTGYTVPELMGHYDGPEHAIEALRMTISQAIQGLQQQSQETSAVEVVSPFESLPTDTPGLGDAIAKLGWGAFALLAGAVIGLWLLKSAWPDVCSPFPILCASEETRR